MSLGNHFIYAARQNEEQLLAFKILLDESVSAWRSSSALLHWEEGDEEETREVDTSRVTVIDWLVVYRYTGEGGDYFGEEAARKDDGGLYASSRTFSIHFIVVQPTSIAHTA